MSIATNKQAIQGECADRSLVVDSLPFYYHVHINEPCNQKCIMCRPTGQLTGQVLPFEDFVAFFDEIKPFAEHITLIGGEPLMYRWIVEVLDLLAEHPIAVTINTNALMVEDRVIRSLLAVHELNLKCSIDAATRPTYLKVRGMDHFDRVTANMRRFADLARDKPHIRVIPHYVVMRENLDEVVPFVDLAAPLRPHRIEFDPVRHVGDWQVENGTGWTFDGEQQSCESFKGKYNRVMAKAAKKCEREGVEHEVHLL